jgi:hypothetical protein
MYLSINKRTFDQNIRLIKVGSPDPGTLKGVATTGLQKEISKNIEKLWGHSL